jgi:splicing factor 1
MSEPTASSEALTAESIEAGKRKRNRWGSPQGEDVSVAQTTASAEEAGKTRKSRFGAPQDVAPTVPSIMLPPPVQLSQEVIQQTVILQLQLSRVNEKLITVVRDALEIEARPDRSPSPPPKYDSNGKRTNTREVRMREALMKEKTRLIEELVKINPLYQPPIDFVKSKPVRRIYLPKQINPNYNYIGLIIGPRGNTQKQMEADTGAKISIRGKGSAKEGSKNRAKNADDDDELHVHIAADNEESVEKAAKMIEALLVPQDDALNEHKQKQLRELALINGTLREDEYCPVCGEKGHRQFECPHRARSFKAAGVKCSICGDLSHPTRDCPLKEDGPTNQVTLDSEYDSFMAELTDGPSRGGKASGEGLSAGAGGSSKGSGGAGGVTSKSGPTYVAPIVDLVSSRKNQTIIHVTTVMTGLTPPVFATTTATTVADGTAPVTAPTMPSLPGYGAAPAASWAVPGYPGGYGAPAPAGYPSGYPGYPAGYPGAYPQYAPVPMPGAAPPALYGAVPPAAPAVPAPPAAAPPPPAANQFHYVYPSGK